MPHVHKFKRSMLAHMHVRARGHVDMTHHCIFLGFWYSYLVAYTGACLPAFLAFNSLVCVRHTQSVMCLRVCACVPLLRPCCTSSALQ